MVEYGATRIYRVMLSMLTNFSRYPLQGKNKTTNPELNESVSSLLSAADINDLSLEDFVLFFERAKSGYYGTLVADYNASMVSEQFSQYLKERDEAIVEFARQNTIALEALGNGERLQTEPMKIGELLNGAIVVSMNKRMSG